MSNSLILDSTRRVAALVAAAAMSIGGPSGNRGAVVISGLVTCTMRVVSSFLNLRSDSELPLA